jgi:hypothetical protein
MPRNTFDVRPAGPCPTAADDRPHTWTPGDGADLLGYGRPDYGATVHLGCCRYCGVALLSVGAYGTERTEQSTCFELPDAGLGEE